MHYAASQDLNHPPHLFRMMPGVEDGQPLPALVSIANHLYQTEG